MADRRRTGLGVGLLLVLAVMYTWAMWYYFTRRVPGGNDFLAHYTVWQAWANDGLNPYSDEAVLYTQLAIYGRPARPAEDQNRLVYPAYSIIVHGPLILVDYPLARAMFMTLLQAALLSGVWMTLRLVSWKPPLWLAASVLVWSLLNYHEARAIVLGQFAILGFFALAGALYLLKRNRDLWAGVLFVLTTIKPPLVFLVAPFLLLWAGARRRWRFAIGFVGGAAFLTLASLLIWPTWIGDWLHRLQEYPEYTPAYGLVRLLAHTALPRLGQIGETALIGILAAGMLWAWWRVLHRRLGGDLEFHWTLGVTMVVSNLIFSQTATPNYVLMLIPTLWVFAGLDRLGRQGRRALLLAMVTALASHWWLHFTTVVGDAEQPIMFVPWPLALGSVLMLGRSWLLHDAAQAEVLP
jgi:hypothetical protein